MEGYDFGWADGTGRLKRIVVFDHCHAGQLDVVRELLDGKQWLVLT